jgi:methylated-DNA-protein-cysteine methyltransferase-like protein
MRYERIWNIVQRIPRGYVATYGQVAVAAGYHRQARFTGYALHALPQGLPVPWHRVINARGRISFPQGSAAYLLQAHLLTADGVQIVDGRIALSTHLWKPIALRISPRKHSDKKRPIPRAY